MIIAQKNGRNTIGAPDKLFGVSAKAKERISQLGKDKVIDSTIGVLLDDDGQLVVLDSVMKSIRALNPETQRSTVPILGLPQYREAVKKAVFLDDMPTDCFVESCYTPVEQELFAMPYPPTPSREIRFWFPAGIGTLII